MDSIFKISKSGTSGILIEGLEKDNSEYIAEDGILVSTRNYAYSQTITLNTLRSVKANGTETFESATLVSHVLNPMDSSVFQLTKDGLYLVSHIILPTKVWFDMILSGYAAELNSYSIVYYYDEPNAKYMKYLSGVQSEVTLEEVLAANYADPALPGELGTTVIRTDKNTFIMYKLNDCFNVVCKNILTQLPTQACSKSSDLSALIEERDILWMGINVIKYNIEMLQLYEAQRFLESITYCGSCISSLLTTPYNCGCNS